jgi:hypothetical protein
MAKYPVKGTDEVREATENDVILSDEIIGTDPDPNVRATLLHEAQAGGAGAGGGGGD